MSLFYEDVVQWMENKEIRYVLNVKFAGKTGFDHMFEFVIPHTKSKPERVVQTVSRPDKNSAMTMAFAWLDTRENRKADSRAFAILNDFERPVRSDVLEAYRSYDIIPIVWSERMETASDLIQ